MSPITQNFQINSQLTYDIKMVESSNANLSQLPIIFEDELSILNISASPIGSQLLVETKGLFGRIIIAYSIKLS